jgi:hypothetical protein
MDNKTMYSQLGEIKVMADLASKGYHIFNQVSGKAPFDLFIYKDGESKRVSVKSTIKDPNSLGKYNIELRRIRSNKNTNTIYKIEVDEFDILAIYIQKEDRIVYLNIDEVIGKTAIFVK